MEEQFYLIFPVTWVLTPKQWRGRFFLGLVFMCAAWSLSIIYFGVRGAFINADTRIGFAFIACGVLMAIHEGRARMLVKRCSAPAVAVVGLMLVLHPVDLESLSAILYETVLVPPSIGLVLLFSLESGSWIRAFLCSRPMQAVGLTSYGIYLWQQLFTAPIQNFSLAGALISRLLPLLFVIVPLSYFWIEKPAIRIGKGFLQRAKQDALLATATS